MSLFNKERRYVRHHARPHSRRAEHPLALAQALRASFANGRPVDERLLIAYLFFNVLRAISNPADFAATFGTPLDNPGDDAFVLVYAIRTLFLGLFGLALFLRRSYASLSLFLLVATVIPLGDALLVWQRDGEPAIIARHIVIAGVVLLTWFLTSRWVRRASAAAA